MRTGSVIATMVLVHHLLAMQIMADSPRGKLGAVVQSAYLASSGQLLSGDATGHYRSSQFRAGKWEIASEAVAEIRFDNRRLNIELHFSKNKPNIDRRIIVFDGNTLMRSDLSKRISVTGSQAYAFPVSKSGSDGLLLGQAGFSWDVSSFPQEIVNTVVLFKNFPDHEQYMKQDASGDIVATFPAKTCTMVVEWAKASGYNARRYAVYGARSKKLVQENTASWKQAEGIWYVSSLSKSLFPSSDDMMPSKEEITFDSFRPNAKVPADFFSMAALKLNDGSRILDQRPDVKDKVHFVPVSDKAVVEKADSLAEQLRSLPVRSNRSSEITNEVLEPRSRTWLLLVLNGVILAIGALAFVVIRRRRSLKE